MTDLDRKQADPHQPTPGPAPVPPPGQPMPQPMREPCTECADGPKPPPATEEPMDPTQYTVAIAGTGLVMLAGEPVVDGVLYLRAEIAEIDASTHPGVLVLKLSEASLEPLG